MIMGLINWSGLFGQNKKTDIKDKVDVNKPVENPDLKKAFELFRTNRTEDNLKKVIDGLLKANLLVLIVTDEMKTSKDSPNNLTVEKGSLLKFLNCFDENSKPFLPAFTDWQEVDAWMKKRDNNVGGFIMTTFDIFEFAKRDSSYVGVVINPGSNPWTMKREQVLNFLNDYKK